MHPRLRNHLLVVLAVAMAGALAACGPAKLTGVTDGGGGTTGGFTQSGNDGGCPQTETSCAGTCTDLQTDTGNCGACGQSCAPAQSCVAGLCACPPGGTLCANACTSLSTDDHNCGSCGHTCGSGQSCVDAGCVGGAPDSGVDAGPDAGTPDGGADAGGDAGIGDGGSTACTGANLTFAISTYPAGRQPIAVAIGALRDAGPDIVVANLTSNSAGVFLNTGAGLFGAQRPFATGQGPAAVALADIDGDGVQDLLVANGTDNTLGVLLGGANGVFGPQFTYAVDPGPSGLAVADFNGDGLPDVAVACYFQGDVDVLLNQGDGGFGPVAAYDDAGLAPQALVAAQVITAGQLDLGVANGNGNGGFDVLFGTGTGAFPTQLDVNAFLQGDAIVAADFNGDGKVDLAVAYTGYLDETASEETNEVLVYRGNGNGTFQTPLTYPTVYTPFGLATGDINGDGIPDLVTAETNANGNVGNVGIFLGNGDGTFQPELSVAAGQGLSAAAVADLNGDGKLDIAVADEAGNALVVLLNSCP
jgi:hypothetical protein